MEIRDPVHGSIHLLKEEEKIIKDNFFQRLRNIKQLGFSEYVFPGATHTRFLHSIGVFHIAGKAFDRIFKNKQQTSEIIRLRETFKLGCLLHDIGHAPLSHSTETVMPTLGELNIPKQYLEKGDDPSRQASHEDYTIKSIVDSSFSDSFLDVEKRYGVERGAIADLIRGSTEDESYFILGGKNYFPILHQLISSELDCDRMDYLLRDSYFCGVSYGNYDLDWILDNLNCCETDGKIYLGLSERAVVTFDDFLLSRYHMFLMVYFHYRPVCLEQLLYRYFRATPGEYTIPADIEEYQKHDDHYLLKHLRNSTNKYAQKIIKNEIPEKIFESFNPQQLNKLEEIQIFLEANNIDFIRCSSSGRLSKYYSSSDTPAHRYPLKVFRKLNHSKSNTLVDINQATDLFDKFSKSHAVNRLHCDLENLNSREKIELLEMIDKY
jgi:HD superfamily phosphohydrolase